MKIVHLVSAGVIGGAEKIALQLATFQHESGSNVELWFLFRGGPIMEEAERLGLKTRLCGLRNGRDLAGALVLKRHLITHHPDIIHVHTFSIGFLVGLTQRKYAVVLQHEHGCIFSSDSWRKKLNNMILRRVVGLADAYIAVSEATRGVLMDTLSIKTNAIHTIPNGVDISLFKQDRDCRRIRKELDIPENSLVVGTVGRLVREKGMDRFVRAAALIRQQLADVRFVIVGDGPCRGELTSLIADLGMVESVSLLGMRNDIPELLSAFDLFALTSNRESFGIALVEAMAGGVPVLAFGVDGIPEIIDEQCGVLLGPGDVEGLAAAALALLRDTGKRSAMAVACRRRAEDFSIRTTFRQVSRLYTELIAARLKTAG